MTHKELPARAADIQRAAASATTCSSATVNSLRSLLLPTPPTDHAQKKPSRRVPQARHKVESALNVKVASTRAKKRPPVTILEISAVEQDLLEPRDRWTLATYVVNSTLQALTEAIRNPSTRSKTAPPVGHTNTQSIGGLNLQRQTALQSLSVNIETKSPGHTIHCRSSSVNCAKEPLAGIRAQADCANLAFTALFSLQESNGIPEIPPLQLESGMSALVAKLIALGFEDLAIRELRILKNRLEGHAVVVAGAEALFAAGCDIGHGKSESKSETLAGMLKFRNIGTRGRTLELIIASQLQVLKLIGLQKKPSVLADSLQYLHLSVPYSPANLIQKQITPDEPETQNKAANQLESLAQLMLLLCQNNSAESNVVSNLDKDLSPHIVFQLQMLALSTRFTWWKLTHHQIDIGREVVSPLCRYLSAFRRQSVLDKRKKYDMAVTASNVISDHSSSLPISQSNTFFYVFQELADLAQDDLQYSEAVRWIRKARDCAIRSEASKLRLCFFDCRIATLQVRSSDPDLSEGLLDALREAASSLEGNLQGESRELDELLVSISSLRKSVYSMFQGVLESQGTARTPNVELLGNESSRLISLCARFLLRYLGNGSSEDQSEKTMQRRNQKLSSALQVAKPAIQSVVAMARFLAQAEPEPWKIVECGLRDCIGLASRLEELRGNGELVLSGDANKISLWVSLSHAYWYRYLYVRKKAAASKETSDCLRISIDLLKNRSLEEKIAASLPTRLEKFGNYCEKILDYQKAIEAYESALRVQIDAGVIAKAASNAAIRSVPEIWDAEEEPNPLCGIIVARARAGLRADEKSQSLGVFYDAEFLAPEERGLIIEQQLIFMLSLFAKERSTMKIHQAINDVAILLLSLYTPRANPVRRCRVIVRLLGFGLTHPNVLESRLESELFESHVEIQESNHADIRLLQYLPHLIESAKLIRSLHQTDPSIEDTKAILASWFKLAHGKTDWKYLKTQVYDIEDWLKMLDFLAEYLDARGLELMRVSTLQLLIAVHEAAAPVESPMLVSRLSMLGTQYVRLGYLGPAGLAIRKGQRYLETGRLPNACSIEWYLSHSEYMLAMKSFGDSRESLKKAQELFATDSTLPSSDKTRSRGRSSMLQTVADACYIHSLLAAAEGCPSKALSSARLSVKNYQRAWATVAPSQNKRSKEMVDSSDESISNELVSSVGAMCLSEHRSNRPTVTPSSNVHGAMFWTLLPRLFRAIAHLSGLFAYCGLFPEVRYYLEQAQRIVESIPVSSLQGRCWVMLGHFTSRSGQVNDGLQMLQQAEKILSGVPHDQYFATLQLFLAMHYTQHGQPHAGATASAAAKKTVQELMQIGFLESLTQKSIVMENLDIQIENLTLQETKSSREPRLKRGQAVSKKVNSNLNSKLNHPPHSPQEIPNSEVISLCCLKGEILRERIQAAILDYRLDDAISIQEEAACLSSHEKATVSQALTASRVRLRQGLDQFLGDAIFCVIPESTISCPAIRSNNSNLNQRSLPDQSRNIAASKSTKGYPYKMASKKGRPQSPATVPSELDFLRSAHLELNEAFRLAIRRSSTATLHQVTDVLRKILVMLSATSSHTSKPPVSSALILYHAEVGRMLSIERAAIAIGVEQNLLQSRDAFDWPKDFTDGQESDPSSDDLDFKTFQAEYIDIIPQSWTAISITISDSRDEIIIGKIRAGQSPFMLRLPLNRHNALESEGESFGFDEGKVELDNIVRSANLSTSTDQDMTVKGAKTAWWNVRSTLDARLKDLLTNIESMWLGGFRGIFSQDVYDSNLLSRFDQSLQNTLDKHLPSRQRSGKGDQSSRIKFDPRVLELFVGLGNPSDNNDVDEALMDLLYFVIDILQFNGERNAYDEVDFDAIAIEVIDALRQFHQAVKDNARSSKQHTILILDKKLHCFPWESLPCLEGHAISRLPSLRCLRDRILLLRTQQEQRGKSVLDYDCISVDRHRGMSILNPAGDLKATQEKFTEPLQQLPHWGSKVQEEPDEAEMKSYLESHDIFLYFGHGSGGQYIRSRTIKKLKKCAVALLMGCSSGALTESGEFEPHGTPLNYMHAGSPAILATLWDVTDKDIDKFSQSVLEKWGLFEKDQPLMLSSPAKKGARSKGKSRVKHFEQAAVDEHIEMSLDEAVSQARDSCLLKYLNGAASVVYGVPVYIS